jgi:hypothetical protein
VTNGCVNVAVANGVELVGSIGWFGEIRLCQRNTSSESGRIVRIDTIDNVVGNHHGLHPPMTLFPKLFADVAEQLSPKRWEKYPQHIGIGFLK